MLPSTMGYLMSNVDFCARMWHPQWLLVKMRDQIGLKVISTHQAHTCRHVDIAADILDTFDTIF